MVTPAERGGDVQPGSAAGRSALGNFAMATVLQNAKLLDSGSAQSTREVAAGLAGNATAAVGMGEAFIGGGCCVSLSVEYTPSSPTVTAVVAVLVRDGTGTVMAWVRTEQPGAGYQVKEAIIATNPGATLVVVVSNATARVRWCEIFSC